MSSSTRLSRFVRSDDPPPMQLTDRDLSILQYVGDYRLLTREQIQRLVFTPTSVTACKRRLTLLYHNRFLGRLALPLRNAYGSARAVYYLERAGVSTLDKATRTATQAYPARSAPSELFLQHTLDVADVRIAFELACASAGGHEFAWTDEATLRRVGVRLRVTGEPPNWSAVVPDGFFTIAAGGVSDGFAVEVDRGTVAEARMRRRFRAYGRWATEDRWRAFSECGSLRVLTVVTNVDAHPGRLARLKAWCEDEGGGSLFWFCDRYAVHAVDIIESPVWAIAGETQRRPLQLSGDL